MKCLSLCLFLALTLAAASYAEPDPRLFQAAASGDLKTLQAMIKQKSDLSAADDDGNTALHHALAARQEAAAALLIKAGADARRKNAAGREPLHLAAGYGLPASAKALLARKADPTAADGEGLTPLHHAAAGLPAPDFLPAALEPGCQEVMKALLAIKSRPKVDINAASRDGYTPLLWALKHMQAKRGQLLIAQGADLRARAKDGTAVIHLAAGRDLTGVVKQCLAKGVDVNLRDQRGWTALRYAAEGDFIPTMELLAAAKNVDAAPLAELVNRPLSAGLTPLYEVLRGGSRRLVELYLKAGAKLETASDQGHTPLMFALLFAADAPAKARPQRLELAALLLDKGADPLVRAKDGRNAYDIAKQAGFADIVKRITQRGFNEADITMRNGNPVLLEAVRAADLKEVERLLAAGASVNIRNRNKRGVLHMLIRPELEELLGKPTRDPATGRTVYAGGRQPVPGPEHFACVRLVLKKGLDVNALDQNERAALHYAFIYEDLEFVRFLLAAGADPNRGGRAWVLDCCGANASLAMVKLLAEAGARSAPGAQEPLAIRLWVLKRMDLLEYLADKGLPLGLPHPRNGRTVLHQAAMDEQGAGLEYFLARGVPVNQEDFSGYTALDYAQERKNEPAAARLLAAGGKPGSRVQPAAPASPPAEGPARPPRRKS